MEEDERQRKEAARDDEENGLLPPEKSPEARATGGRRRRGERCRVVRFRCDAGVDGHARHGDPPARGTASVGPAIERYLLHLRTTR